MSFYFLSTKTRVLCACVLVPLLSACSYTMNQNPFMAGVVQSMPLSDGKLLNVGYSQPAATAECQLINESSRNWSLAQTVGQFKAGGGRQVLRDEALASVEQRPQDGVNYVALTIPNEVGIGIVDATALKNAKTSYFRCVTPPQPRS